MPETIPIDHCPAVELVPLPSKAVTTVDGHQLALGSIVYFRFGTGPGASEYAVLGSHALKVIGGYKVAVIGPAGVPGWLQSTDLVKDIKEWWAFYKKRYAPTPPPKEEEPSVKRSSKGRGRTKPG